MKNKEFDIERSSYDDKVEEIRKKKRQLRNIQEPGLVKKMKRDLKTEQRAAKRSEKNSLKNYIKGQIDNYGEENEQQPKNNFRMKYICIESFDRHSKQFTKGDTYIINTPISEGGKYREIRKESGEYITTIAITTINKHLISLDVWRENQINEALS